LDGDVDSAGGGSLGLESPRTLVQAVAERLRESILLGRLEPGARLRQDSLAEEFQVSRIPVREALRLLSAEGLVDLHPQRGARVSELSLAALEELYLLGELVEGAATEMAVARMTDAELRRIEQCHEQMTKPGISATEWHQLNRSFHELLVAPAERPRFSRIANEVRANTRRYVRPYLELMGGIERWDDDHAQIVDACRRKDAAEARLLVERHWQKMRRSLADHLASKGHAGAAKRRK